MKTNRIIFLFAAAAMLCSCARELATDETYSQNGEGQLTLNVNLDQVKTALGQKEGTTYPQTWSAGDYLVLNGVASEPLAEGGRKGAAFVFNSVFEAPYNVVYCGKAEAPDVIVFPAKQSYVAGTFAPFTAPLYGSGSNVNEITMQPINAALRIPFTGEATISKIVVEALGGEKISGEFTLGKTAGVYDGTFAPTEAASSLSTLDCGEGVALSQEETPFFVTLPAGTYTEGFRIYAVSSDKKAMVLKLGSLTSVAAGKVYELPVKDFVAGDTYVLAEPADMDVLTTLTDGAGVGKTVILVDDIDMTGKAWTSFGSGGTVTNPGNFTATLDGQGHTISGLTTPLFGNFAGILKNLTVDANVTFTGNTTYYKGSTYGIGLVAGYVTNALSHTKGTVVVENVTTRGSLVANVKSTHNYQVGGLFGVNNGATIRNCTNEADVTYNNEVTSGFLIMGGVLGLSQTSTIVPDISGLTNKGKVSFTGKSTGDYTYVGGVIGQIKADSKSTISNLRNEGALYASGTILAGSKKPFFAGVAGYVTPKIKFTACSNSGDIHFSIKPSITQPSKSEENTGEYCGGVFGSLEAKGSSLEDVNNSGNIYLDEGYIYTYCAIGGVVAYTKTEFVLTNVTNTGDIIGNTPIVSNNGSWARIGGILGHSENGNSLTASYCSNSGDITFNDATGSGNIYAGGCFGNIKATTVRITSATNSGNIVFNGVADGSAGVKVATGGMIFGGICSSFDLQADNTSIEIIGETGISTNTGKIALYENGAISYPVIAGGIVGNVGGAVDKHESIVIKNCTNAGIIDRKLTGYTYEETGYKRIFAAGGIVGKISSDVNKYIASTIENCTNTADIQFSKNDGTTTPLSSASQEIDHAGGILGQGGGSKHTDTRAVIKCCRNSGNILSIEGYCGGIAGYVWAIDIVGEKGNYCTNNGNVAFRGNPSIRPQTTAGGIVGGYSEELALEWCYNTGVPAGNNSASGLIGKINAKDGAVSVKHCKTYGLVCCTSTWSKAGLIFGFTNGASGYTESSKLLANVSDIAVGGQICYGVSSADKYITLTSENYLNHLYYNKVTAPAAAQSSTAAVDVITSQVASEKNITLWDGTSTLPWEN